MGDLAQSEITYPTVEIEIGDTRETVWSLQTLVMVCCHYMDGCDTLIQLLLMQVNTHNGIV